MPRPTAAADLPTLATTLHSAAIHLLRRLRREDDATGLPAPQLSVLSVVAHAGPITLGALARAEQVRPPTMTRVVAALEEAGLVTRAVDAADRRIARISITPAGRRLFEAGRSRRVAALTDRLALLTQPELETLRRASEILERVAGREALTPPRKRRR